MSKSMPQARLKAAKLPNDNASLALTNFVYLSSKESFLKGVTPSEYNYVQVKEYIFRFQYDFSTDPCV